MTRKQAALAILIALIVRGETPAQVDIAGTTQGATERTQPGLATRAAAVSQSVSVQMEVYSVPAAVSTPYWFYLSPTPGYGPWPVANTAPVAQPPLGPPVPFDVVSEPLRPAPPGLGQRRLPLLAPVPALPQRPGTRFRSDPEAMEQLLTYGDRNLRAGDRKRAQQRYEQARDAARDRPDPLVRLAYLALIRGHYQESALRLREAFLLDPDWIERALDPQRLFLEPAGFSHLVDAVETHLQSHPEDRDAWLTLGSALLLSGRHVSALDIFIRLEDGSGDPLLSRLQRWAQVAAGTDPGERVGDGR